MGWDFHEKIPRAEKFYKKIPGAKDSRKKRIPKAENFL